MRTWVVKPALVVLIACLTAGGFDAAALARPKVDVDAYEGLAAWIDIYDRGPWRDPERAVTRMKRRGVSTLFLQTSNYQKRRRLFRSRILARFLRAAHARDIKVVAWYLPGFNMPRRRPAARPRRGQVQGGPRAFRFIRPRHRGRRGQEHRQAQPTASLALGAAAPRGREGLRRGSDRSGSHRFSVLA